MRTYFVCFAAITGALLGCSSPGVSPRSDSAKELARIEHEWLNSREGELTSEPPPELSVSEVETLRGISASQTREIILGVASKLKASYNYATDFEILSLDVQSAESYRIRYRCRNPKEKRRLVIFLRGAIEHAFLAHPSYSDKPYPRDFRASVNDSRPEFSGRPRADFEVWLYARMESARQDSRLKGNNLSAQIVSSTNFKISYSYRNRNESDYVLDVLNEYFDFDDELKVERANLILDHRR